MNCLCSTSRHSRNPPPSCHPPQHNFQQISKNSHHPLLHPDGKIFQRRHPETAGSQTQSGSKCLLRFPAYKTHRASSRPDSHLITLVHICLLSFWGRLGCHENKTAPIPNRFVRNIRERRTLLSPKRNSSQSDRKLNVRRQLEPTDLWLRAVCREALQLLLSAVIDRAASCRVSDSKFR